jgi:hypothetical protein
VTRINVPGSQVTYVGGINNREQVAGYYQNAQGVAHDFLWSKDQFTTIDPPGSPRGIVNLTAPPLYSPSMAWHTCPMNAAPRVRRALSSYQ